ncbi:TBC1 domain family member 15-like [Hydractinia symbiolongicarpus]|uniref:TBC1 domain family member 15-like n=1 Tax=Hydractinia symbiolongicarpus TaxID=13093 RepID=UPI0025500C03|nr:TBC1 domain family member 15-like [Hydractinia symbiolongicarpus]
MAAAAVVDTQKVLYTQEDVFVHTAVTSSTLYDDIIRGQLCVIDRADGIFVDWQPLSDLTPELEFEVHSLFSGPHEYGVVTTQEKNPAITSQPLRQRSKDQPYKVSFDVEKIHSIRRSDPRLAWSYIVFILKDGSTQPALHFHGGGIKNLISTLQRYIWLTRSPDNHRLYVVQEKDTAMESAVNQFELFVEKPGDTVSKLLNNTYYGTLSRFSKVTQYVMESMGQNDLIEKRPNRESTRKQNDSVEEGDYEFLAHDELDVLGPIIPAARGNPLQPEEWCAFMNDDGQIFDVAHLKERIFRGGIHADIKREAWKFLLGYYKFDSTYAERAETKAEKARLYEVMKLQWMSITPQQESRFTDFANKKHLVDKDTLRTDRKKQFYSGEDNLNVKKLFNVLMTYCMYNFDLGYVQGMSDLLSPILMLMEDEVDSFWCFVGLMEIEERNFEMTQHLMKLQLENLGKLVQYLYPRFWNYLKTHESDNLYFCFRWVLITFKREFSTDDLMTLWEVLWTQNLTPHFKLFVCLAILEKEKDLMMKKNYGFNEILKHINDLMHNIDLQFVLSRAESICLKLQNTEDVPEDLKDMIFSMSIKPKKDIDQSSDDSDKLDQSESIEDNVVSVETMEVSSNGKETETLLHNASGERQIDNCASTRPSDDAVSSRPSDDAVVELKESTKSVF